MDRCLGAVLDADFGEEIGDVELDVGAGEMQGDHDFLVAEAGLQVPQHFKFAFSEGLAFAALLDLRGDPRREIGCALVNLPNRVEHFVHFG